MKYIDYTTIALMIFLLNIIGGILEMLGNFISNLLLLVGYPIRDMTQLFGYLFLLKVDSTFFFIVMGPQKFFVKKIRKINEK